MESPADIPVRDARVDQLVSLLDAEIEDVRSKRHQPGWTKWAIMGGLATLCWLALAEIESGAPTLVNIIQLLLVASFVGDLWFFLKFLVTARRNEDNTPIRYGLTSQLLAGNRLLPIIMLIRYVGVVIIVFRLSALVGLYVTLVSYGLVAFWLLVSLVFVLLSYLQFPIPVSDTSMPWLATVLLVFLIVANGFVVERYLLALLVTGPGVSIPDLRLAGLASVIYYLTTLLVGLSSPSPLLDSLLVLRRGLVFGRLDFDEAVEQIDIALVGLKLSDVMQSQVNKMLGLFDQANAEVNQAIATFSALERVVDRLSGDVSVDDEIIVRSLLDRVAAHTKSFREIFVQRIPDALTQFERRINIISRQGALSVGEAKQLLGVIRLAFDNSKGRSDELVARATALIEKYS